METKTFVSKSVILEQGMPLHQENRLELERFGMNVVTFTDTSNSFGNVIDNMPGTKAYMKNHPESEYAGNYQDEYGHNFIIKAIDIKFNTKTWSHMRASLWLHTNTETQDIWYRHRDKQGIVNMDIFEDVSGTRVTFYFPVSMRLDSKVINMWKIFLKSLGYNEAAFTTESTTMHCPVPNPLKAQTRFEDKDWYTSYFDAVLMVHNQNPYYAVAEIMSDMVKTHLFSNANDPVQFEHNARYYTRLLMDELSISCSGKEGTSKISLSAYQNFVKAVDAFAEHLKKVTKVNSHES